MQTSSILASLSSQFEHINPNEHHGQCFWAAYGGAKILFNFLENREMQNVMNIENIDPDQSDEWEKQVQKYESRSLEFNDRKNLISWLKNLENKVVIIAESSEGDHVYNLFKYDDKIFLLDGDRKLFLEINSEKDFIQPVSGWKNQDTLFDFFSCQQVNDKNINDHCSLNIHIMSNTLLESKFQPKQRESRSKENLIQKELLSYLGQDILSMNVIKGQIILERETFYKIYILFPKKSLTDLRFKTKLDNLLSHPFFKSCKMQQKEKNVIQASITIKKENVVHMMDFLTAQKYITTQPKSFSKK